MSPRSEYFLYLMLWGADTLMHPTLHNFVESFEGWAYRSRLLPRIRQLEELRFIEKKPGNLSKLLYRLTEEGRLEALGGIDPEARWNRSWDGNWRMVVFDVPENQNSARVRLRRCLKGWGFGYLQNSVWITPDSIDSALQQAAIAGGDAESLLTLEARPCLGQKDQSLVAGGWDFEWINGLYQESAALLKKVPRRGRDTEARIREWARREQEAWKAVVRADPFLPSLLLPRGYAGKKVWHLRNSVLRQAGEWLASSSTFGVIMDGR